MKLLKKTAMPFLLTIILFLSCFNSRNMQGIIFYETSISDEKVKELYQNYLQVLELKELRALVTEKSQLYFNKSESLWETSGIVNLEGKLSAYSKYFNKVEVKYYRDVKAKEFFETTRFPKNKDGFFEMGSEPNYNWILTENKDTILGYECPEAILKDETGATALKVYYTPDIKASVGPSKHYGLDGVILKVYIPTEYTTILAYKVELRRISKTFLEKPDTTNLVQRAEYIEILTKGRNK